MPIQIGTATVEYTANGCVTRYPDGTHYGAQPHDTPDYDEVAERSGYLALETTTTWPANPTIEQYAAARLRYCREHEVCHHIVGQAFYGGPSPVLWALAHGDEVDARSAALEEAMVMTLQRWIRAGERPIIGGVDWFGLERQALALLDAV